MPSENPNNFFDKFKFLTRSAAKIDTMRQQVAQYLATELPSRILSKANIFNLTIDVSRDMTNLTMGYIGDSLNEQNIYTAQTESGIRSIGRYSGHDATRGISSRGAVTIKLLSGIQEITPVLKLNNSTKLKCKNNNLVYEYDMNEDFITIPTTNSEFNIQLVEGEVKTQEYVADGEKLYTVYLDDTKTIEEYDIRVYVNGIKWTKFDGKYDMNSQSEGYLVKNGFDNQVDIIFGDGAEGVVPKLGDKISVSYRITNGEEGNLDSISETAEFEFSTGLLDANNDEVDVTDFIKISYKTGFSLGSNGEHIEVTRQIAGYNSRARVFANPSNVKAYLSRFSTLSHVDAWTEENSIVFNILVLPNLESKLGTYSEYLSIDTSYMLLSDTQKSDIVAVLSNSERMFTSSEKILHDATLKKYALFVYADATVFDKASFKDTVYSEISKIMLNETFADVDLNNEQTISKGSLYNAIYDLPEVNSLAINLFSESNEIARIQGEYQKTETVIDGSIKRKRTVTIDVPSSDDPNLGFNELGDIYMTERNSIPILRGGFDKYADDQNHVTLEKPIYIFLKDEFDNYREI